MYHKIILWNAWVLVMFGKFFTALFTPIRNYILFNPKNEWTSEGHIPFTQKKEKEKGLPSYWLKHDLLLYDVWNENIHCIKKHAILIECSPYTSHCLQYGSKVPIQTSRAFYYKIILRVEPKYKAYVSLFWCIFFH